MDPLDDVEQGQIAALYARHRPMIVAIYQRSGGPHTGIELDDWLQQAFFVLLQASRSFNPNHRTNRGNSVKFTTYLYRCLVNAILRMRKVECRVVSVPIDQHVPPTDGIDPEARIDIIDINTAVSRMCDRSRSVWSMHMNGYSTAEIATATRQSVPSVRKRLQRARTQVRSKLCA